MTKAIIYARVSTESEQQSTSIPTQITRCTDYCKAMGYTVVATYSEEYSGRTLNRPGWNQLTADIKDGHGDTIVATALDRLTRTDEFMGYVRDVLAPHNANFVTLHEKIDTSSASGRLVLSTLVMIAQFQAEQTAEKTAAAMRSIAESGRWAWRVPFGMIATERKGIPTADDTWPYVVEIFERSARGETGGEILKWLHANEVRGARGGTIGHSTLANILGNQLYKGVIATGGNEYPAHPDIPRIDTRLWERAQKRIKARGGRKPAQYAYLLDGKVYSSQWQVTQPTHRKGDPVPYVAHSGTGRGKTYHYYHRADKRRKFGGLEVAGDGPPVCIPAEQLDNAVLDGLLEFAGDQEQLTRKALAQTRKAIAGMDAAIARKQKQLRKIEADMDKIVDKVIDHDGPATELMKRMGAKLDALKDQSEILQAAILGLQDARAMTEAQDVDSMFVHVNQIEQARRDGHTDELRGLLDMMVESVDLQADGDELSAKLYLRSTPLLRELLAPMVKKAAPMVAMRLTVGVLAGRAVRRLLR